MGNREDLLAGAKRCLYERGYGRTTARDIVAASGANLAAIGYHFGSKEALLNQALIEASQEWGDELERALVVDHDDAATPLQRFESTWNRVIELFASHQALFSASFEMITQVDHAPEIRRFLMDTQVQARIGLATVFQDIDPEKDRHTAETTGAFYQALLTGVMMQWLIDPERAPSGSDLAAAVRAIASTESALATSPE